MASLEGDPHESTKVKASSAPVSWNLGVQGSVRTSFASRTPSQLLLTSGSTPISDQAEENDTGKSDTVNSKTTVTHKTEEVVDGLVSSQSQNESGLLPKLPKRAKKKKRGRGRGRGKKEDEPSQLNDQLKLEPLNLTKEVVGQSHSESDEGLADATIHLQMADEDTMQGPVFWMGRLLGINRAQSVGSGEPAAVAEFDSASMIKRYFPSALDSTVCLTCMSKDHLASACPSLICETCGSHGSHFTHACPQNQRCSKCRQQGHQKSNCPEKLAASSSEIQSCSICDGIDHLETACPVIWRSFKPVILSLKMVQHIPIHCYCCGREGHFGTECGLRQSQAYKGSSTWTKTNWDQYVNPQSQLRAVSAGVDYSLRSVKRKDFNIKGHAKNNPITLEDDSDQDNADFIRPRINPAPPRKQLNIKRNEDNYRPNPPEPYPDQRPPARYQLSPRTSRPTFNRFNDDDYYGDRERRRSRSPPPRFDDRVRRRTPTPPGRSAQVTDQRGRRRGRGRGRGHGWQPPVTSRPVPGRGSPQIRIEFLREG